VVARDENNVGFVYYNELAISQTSNISQQFENIQDTGQRIYKDAIVFTPVYVLVPILIISILVFIITKKKAKKWKMQLKIALELEKNLSK
jgi:hypothetical protein